MWLPNSWTNNGIELKKNDGIKVNTWIISEPNIPLYLPCAPDELCADENAGCNGGQCLCTSKFYEANNKCGKVTHIMVSMSLTLGY